MRNNAEIISGAKYYSYYYNFRQENQVQSRIVSVLFHFSMLFKLDSFEY